MVESHDLSIELSSMIEFVDDEEWINIIENGTYEEVVEALGEAFQPLTYKLLNSDGPTITRGMPKYLIKWIKDSVILWVRKKGGEWEDPNEEDVPEPPPVAPSSTQILSSQTTEEIKKAFTDRINTYIK